METKELLRAEDGVFGRFGHTEFYHPLGRNLDLFAGGRVASDAGLAIYEHEFSEAGEGEGILGVLVGHLHEVLDDGHGLLLGDFVFFCDL